MGIIKLGAPLRFATIINRGIGRRIYKSACKTQSTVLQDRDELVYRRQGSGGDAEE